MILDWLSDILRLPPKTRLFLGAAAHAFKGTNDKLDGCTYLGDPAGPLKAFWLERNGQIVVVSEDGGGPIVAGHPENIAVAVQAAFQPKRQDTSMSVDLLNRALRPLSVYGLIAVGLIFLLGLGLIMLFRFAAYGEIDLQGLAAFGSMFLLPVMQHFQNRSTEKRAQIGAGGLVNNAAIA